MKEGKSATLIICLEGIKVIDNKTQRVAMAHALHRVCIVVVDVDVVVVVVVVVVDIDSLVIIITI